MNSMIVVPSGWVVYEITDDEVDKIVEWATAAGKGAVDAPSVAVMEALVMAGKAKRLAAIHTFNASVPDEDDEESESPFYQADPE